jgi:hypothetical protein
MPKLLVQRIKGDSINQFHEAAIIRDKDAERLLIGGNLSGAVYLWGYVAEMTLKAAWFKLIGFPDSQIISRKDLEAARKFATQSNISWPSNFHALDSWANLIIYYRISQGKIYSEPSFSNRVLANSARVYARWRETLRYKKNIPYLSEALIVGDSARWLLNNSKSL